MANPVELRDLLPTFLDTAGSSPKRPLDGASLLSLLYLCEGLVRATSDRGLSHYLAMIEVALATTLLLGCALFARWTARHQPA